MPCDGVGDKDLGAGALRQKGEGKQGRGTIEVPQPFLTGKSGCIICCIPLASTCTVTPPPVAEEVERPFPTFP